MADSINEILDKLSKIDEAACRLEEAAGEQKKAIRREHKERVALFDRKLGDEYKDRLDKTAGELKRKADDKIDRINSELMAASDKLDADYAKNKEKWADAIFKAVIEV